MGSKPYWVAPAILAKQSLSSPCIKFLGRSTASVLGSLSVKLFILGSNERRRHEIRNKLFLQNRVFINFD